MTIKLVSIGIADKNVLRQMLFKYEKELTGVEPDEYKYLDSYWQDPGRSPYFITVDRVVAGFVLINNHLLVQKEGKNLSEFYIKKEFRKSGIGTEAAKLAYQLFPGKWETRQIHTNLIAHTFWLKVISEFTHNNFQEVVMDNDQWHGWVQTFDSSAI